MPYKAVIKKSTMPQYIASVSIYDEKGHYETGYYVTEIVDERDE